MKDLQSLKVFVRVARLGSFSAAARECGLSQPQASRLVADLEESLGARLLSRSTRAVKPTDAGEEFLVRIESILAALDEAESGVRDDADLRGTLRIGMPASFGARVVLPDLAPFADRHPKLRIEIMLDDRFQDMVREAVDVTIRVGSRPDSSGTSRQIGVMDRIVVASPKYLAHAGTPRSPADLSSHRIVSGPAASSSSAWQFERNGETSSIAIEPRIVVNDTIGAVAAVRGGLGITSTTSWSCEDELEDGSLVRILGRWKMAALPIFAFFPSGRSARRSARVFVEFLANEIHARRA